MRSARTGVVVSGVLLSPSRPGAAPAAQPAIIDGGDAGSLHSAARMFTGGQEICSATIIAPDWILTARHCTQGAGGKPISFHVGDLDQRGAPR